MWRRIIAVLILTALPGCSPFSDMQDGRVLDKGEGEVTPYYSSTGITGSGGVAEVQTGYGVIAGIGLVEQRKLDLRLRYEQIEFGSLGEAIHVLSFGPKLRMRSDYAAFYLPVGFAIGDDIVTADSWEIQPTFLMTNSSLSWLETTFSAKGLIRFADEPDPRIAFNLGMGIGPDPHRLAIRPEAGILISPESGGLIYQLSIGLTVGFGEPRTPRVKVDPSVENYVADSFAISDQQFKASYSEVVVTGDIVNQGGVDRDRVRFKILCTDPLGAVLATAHFELSGLTDGVPRHFEVRISGFELDRVSRCQVRPVWDESD